MKIKLGCHVGNSGSEMLLGSVKEALSYAKSVNVEIKFTSPGIISSSILKELKLQVSPLLFLKATVLWSEVVT